MSYYHIILEVNDNISTIEETRDIELFDIVELQPYLHSILLPYFNEQILELDDDNNEAEYLKKKIAYNSFKELIKVIII